MQSGVSVVHRDLSHLLSAIEQSRREEELIVWSLSGAGFVLGVGSKTVYIDPYLNYPAESGKRRTPVPFPVERVSKVDYVVNSHEHADHCDAKTLGAIAENTDAVFLGPVSTATRALQYGFPKHRIHSMAAGEFYEAQGFTVRAFEPLDYYAESAAMFFFETPWGNVLHSGDSLYTENFKRIGDSYEVDIAMLDYGKQLDMDKQYYMDAAAVAKAARDLNARILVPMHWDIFHARYEDPEKIRPFLTQEAPKCRLLILEQGDELRYNKRNFVA
jgi:L-ascorbate 6-phosphate lactonase